MPIPAELGKILEKAEKFLAARALHDQTAVDYYEGNQSLMHLGLATPRELSALEVVINWPRLVVDSIEERQDIKNIVVPGNEDAENLLLGISDFNNLDSELCLWRRDRLIYGRGFLSVGANPSEGLPPLIRVESPREMCVKIDSLTQKTEWACRIVQNADRDENDKSEPKAWATVYTPFGRYHLVRTDGWQITEAVDHGIGQVPVFLSVNRRKTGSWIGESEMADIIPLTDAVMRTVTDLQAAVETNAMPKKVILGADQNDFQSEDGWTNYLNPLIVIGNSAGRFGTFDAANLANFTSVIEQYGKLAASVTGFPARYFGLTTTNPPSADTVRQEEARLIKRVERINAECGGSLARAFAAAARIAGSDIEEGYVNVEWHDPATPTLAQKADAAQKLAGGRQIISVEGAWDLMGWNRPRMDLERGRLAKEATDATLDALLEKRLNDGQGA